MGRARGVGAVVALALIIVIAGCTRVDQATHVGETLHLTNASGESLAVTLTKVTDPAKGVGPATPPPTERFVGVSFVIADTASRSFVESVSADAILISSDGQRHLPSDITLTHCAMFHGDIKLTPRGAISGCVGFEVSRTAQIAEVQFLPAGGAADNYGEWPVG